MRAARVHRHGGVPVVEDVDPPAGPRPGEGRAVVEVLAAPLNPVDLSIASGRFYAGAPPLPHAPGQEGAGRVLAGDRLEPGTLVYFGDVPGDAGSFAERAPIEEAGALVLPEGADPVLAACLGIAGLAAWLPLERARTGPGDRVLVLGASGAVGQIAVQGAGLLGAERVVAAARSEDGLARARELGAHATVQLDDAEDLPGRLQEAAGGPLDVVVDPLWGAPAAAAVAAMATGGRLVQVGQSAGAEAALRSADIRGRQLEILGHANAAVPWEDRHRAHLRLLEHASAGELTVDRETMPLDAIADAWERQAGAPHLKLVLVP